MRELVVGVLGLAACGRLGFDETARDAHVTPGDVVDASPCITSSVDWASAPIPNDPSSGLPNLASRTASASIVTDNITGLEWEQTVAGAARTWDAAKMYCESLQKNGGCWRLPERIELATIVDYSAMFPAIDDIFTATPTSAFWTATAVSTAPERRWVVNFDLGYIQNVAATGTAMVRCVRGAQNALPRYEVSGGGGTVLDTKTGLTWQRAVVGTYNWSDARTYCSTLDLEGGGWRSPSIQELESLVDTTQTSVLVDPSAFPNTPISMFWSGSMIQNDPSMGWTIDFGQGFAFRPITAQLPTRCVR